MSPEFNHLFFKNKDLALLLILTKGSLEKLYFARSPGVSPARFTSVPAETITKEKAIERKV